MNAQYAMFNAKTLECSNELAVDINLVRTLLDLDITCTNATIATIIKHATNEIEWRTGYALIWKKFEFEHTNPSWILAPQRPITNLISIEKYNTKTHHREYIYNSTDNTGADNYIQINCGKFDYLRILPSAFIAEERQSLGLSNASKENDDKKYHKPNLKFIVTYEAGEKNKNTNTSGEYQVASRIPAVFQNLIIKEIARLFNANYSQQHTPCAFQDQPRIFVGKL